MTVKDYDDNHKNSNFQTPSFVVLSQPIMITTLNGIEQFTPPWSVF